MKIGIYGGSFNPVHFGHVNVARKAIDTLALDRLIVVPANVSPFKTETPPAAELPWNRLECVRNAFGGMERVVVDDREMLRGGVSYAIDTVREIRASFMPSDEFYFIIGEDSVAGLPRWKDYETLKTLVTFVSFPRTRESSTEIRTLFEQNAVVCNPDEQMVAIVRKGLTRKEGFCPCRLAKTPENFCPCEEFRQQLADPAFHGLCHCRYFLKPPVRT